MTLNNLEVTNVAESNLFYFYLSVFTIFYFLTCFILFLELFLDKHAMVLR